MRKREILIVLTILVLDQFTKYLVSSKMALHQSITLIPSFFSITLAHNTGAAWSMMDGAGVVFVVLAGAASLGMAYYLEKNKDLDWMERTGICLMMAGAVGNMIDRVVHGFVIDFLDFIIIGYDFPVFNVADIALCIGVGLLILDILIHKEKA